MTINATNLCELNYHSSAICTGLLAFKSLAPFAHHGPLLKVI